jgi:hypothetical protein
MGRLVTFGCSYTYGIGLEDIYGSKKVTEPSKLAWPTLLGQLLDKTTINESAPGSGNFEIFDKIIRYNFQPDDLVIIMWSHFIRLGHYKILEKNYKGQRKGSMMQAKHTAILMEFDNAYKNYQIFHHANLYLESKKIDNYSFIAFFRDRDSFPCPSFFEFSKMLTIQEDYHIDMALDREHFGHKSHEKLANILYNKIK